MGGAEQLLICITTLLTEMATGRDVLGMSVEESNQIYRMSFTTLYIIVL